MTGVRPSSGAETSADREVSELPGGLGGPDGAAPEDGRTPTASRSHVKGKWMG
jgi:hypothetical protein